MKRKRVKNLFLMIFTLVFLVAGLTLPSQAEKATTKSPKDKATVEKTQAEKALPLEKTPAKKATLRVVSVSGNTASIELTNTVPVRGIQFTLKGVEMTEVRTTSLTAGFLAKFNEENGIVILASLSGDEIAPGKGSIAEIIYKKVPGSTSTISISLSGVKMVGRDREEL